MILVIDSDGNEYHAAEIQWGAGDFDRLGYGVFEVSAIAAAAGATSFERVVTVWQEVTRDWAWTRERVVTEEVEKTRRPWEIVTATAGVLTRVLTQTEYVTAERTVTAEDEHLHVRTVTRCRTRTRTEARTHVATAEECVTRELTRTVTAAGPGCPSDCSGCNNGYTCDTGCFSVGGQTEGAEFSWGPRSGCSWPIDSAADIGCDVTLPGPPVSSIDCSGIDDEWQWDFIYGDPGYECLAAYAMAATTDSCPDGTYSKSSDGCGDAPSSLTVV